MAAPNEPVSITPAELKLLEALIELEKEDREGSASSVTVYDSTNALAFWAKIGRWAWRNRWKLVAITEAATDLIGFDVVAQPGLETKVSIKALADEPSLDDLIRARDQVYRAMEKQEKERGR